MRTSMQTWALAALLLVIGTAAADEKAVAKVAPKKLTFKRQIECKVDTRGGPPKRPDPTSKVLYFRNLGIGPLPAGTRIEWEVRGVPYGCCKGTATTEQVLPPNGAVSLYQPALTPAQGPVSCRVLAIF